MIREYKTIQEVNGPLMVVKKVQGVAYDELGEIELPDGTVRRCIPLPLAGLMSTLPPEELLEELTAFLTDCGEMGFSHADLMSFFTIMPLAVSPEIKCTDRGLLDVAHKRFLPLIEKRKGEH